MSAAHEVPERNHSSLTRELTCLNGREFKLEVKLIHRIF